MVIKLNGKPLVSIVKALPRTEAQKASTALMWQDRVQRQRRGSES